MTQDGEHSEYARGIVERLLEGGDHELDLDGTLVVSDVENNAADFVADLAFLEAIDADVPAVRVGDEDLVPVALSTLPNLLGRSPVRFDYYGPAAEYERYLRFLRRPRRVGPHPGDLGTITREQARSTFVRRATAFLATRIGAIRDVGRNAAFGAAFLHLAQRLRRSTRVSTLGCHFTVSSNSPGLRVFWSGAYRISSNYFSSPTTPVGSILQSGTYVFGVDGGGYGSQIQWDFNAIVTLPGHPGVHLNF